MQTFIYDRLTDAQVNLIYNKIFKTTDILILTHIQPDGDSVGCSSSMYSFCKRLSKIEGCNISNIVYGGMNDIPRSLQFLPNVDKYQILTDVPENFIYNKDALILALDSSNGERCIPNYEERKDNLCDIINIDHHPNNTSFGNINYIESSSASCSELIGSFIMQVSKLKNLTPILKENEACALYTGIKTDTGNFKYSSVTSQTMFTAASISQFLPKNAIIDIDEKLTKTKAADYPLVYGKILSDLTYTNNDEVAIMVCRKKLLSNSSVTGEDIKGLVNFPFEVVPVRLTILITEVEEDNTFNVSVRSRPPYNAKSLATKLGGGGHEAASGAIVHGKTYSELMAIIMKEVSLM